jgi:hypothetical protein
VTFKEQRFPNLVSFWNRYYANVHEHLSGRADLAYLRLEQLVEDPVTVLEDLRLSLGFAPKPGVEPKAVIRFVSNRPSKGYNTFGQAAREKYRIENVHKMISAKDLDFINSSLDPLVMKRLGLRYVWTEPVIERTRPRPARMPEDRRRWDLLVHRRMTWHT